MGRLDDTRDLAPTGAEMPGLTVGRMVHYVNHDGAHLAAIVTGLSGVPGVVSLTAFHPTKPPSTPVLVPYDESGARAVSWHWIERA